MSESRIEELFKKLTNGESIEDFQPLSRSEAYLKAALTNAGTEDLPDPVSRLDVLLYGVADKFGDMIDPETEVQEKTVTPTSETQVIKPDPGHALSKVTVEGVYTLDEFIRKRDCHCLFYGTHHAYSLTDEDLFNTISYSDTSNATDMSYMFYNNDTITRVPLLDTSNVTDMTEMFHDCESIEEIPAFDTSKVTKMSDMLYQCKKLKKIPYLDISNAVNTDHMMHNCESLTEVPIFDLRSCTDSCYMYCGCQKLSKIEVINANNIRDMSGMFSGCYGLKEVSTINTANTKFMSSMFSNCRVMETAPDLDARNATNLSQIVFNCYKLTHLTIKNIKTELTIGSGSRYGHLLTLDSLINIIRELRDTGASLKLTVGTDNLTKLANIYVKTIEITDEMRAADDLIDEKLPFEVCESTDEGAMLIKEYVGLKHWALA